MKLVDIILFFLAAIILFFLCFHNSAVKTGRGAKDKVKDLTKHPRSKSEAAVIKIIESLTHHKFPTVNPAWLVWQGRQLELDGYCKKLNIAVEFSGPLHTKWAPSDESYTTYITRVSRDIVKRCICAHKGVTLIVIDMSLPSHHWTNYIKSRLYDIGYITDKPFDYIIAQVAKPFRNEVLERDLGIKHIMANAEALCKKLQVEI
jgi:hypothetical protein